jgi:hypothetical protein
MLPDLSSLQSPKNKHWKFENVNGDGTTVAKLEEREPGKLALVGASCNSFIQLAAPEEAVDGYARVIVCNSEGICRDEDGVKATRLFLAALYNQGKGNVIITEYGFIVGRWQHPIE